jgi:hypothetical protein
LKYGGSAVGNPQHQVSRRQTLQYNLISYLDILNLDSSIANLQEVSFLVLTQTSRFLGIKSSQIPIASLSRVDCESKYLIWFPFPRLELLSLFTHCNILRPTTHIYCPYHAVTQTPPYADSYSLALILLFPLLLPLKYFCAQHQAR